MTRLLNWQSSYKKNYRTMPNSHRLRLLGMIDEGMVDPKAILEAMIGWLSNDDVGEFLDTHELSERFEETDDE